MIVLKTLSFLRILSKLKLLENFSENVFSEENVSVILSAHKIHVRGIDKIN